MIILVSPVAIGRTESPKMFKSFRKALDKNSAIIIVTIMEVQKVFASKCRPIQCPLHSLNLAPINKSLAQSSEDSRGPSNYLLIEQLDCQKSRGGAGTETQHELALCSEH
jgi:hypothetical protein